jgi:hypothetical protein
MSFFLEYLQKGRAGKSDSRPGGHAARGVK